MNAQCVASQAPLRCYLVCAPTQVNLPTDLPALPPEVWLRILYDANKGGKFVRRMATFDSALAEAARKHEDNDGEAAAALDAKMRRELAPLVLRRKQADELARQAQNDLYLGELERVASEQAQRRKVMHEIHVDIFGSDYDSEEEWEVLGH